MTSKQRRGGLGRGLGALIPTAPAEARNEPSAAEDPAFPDGESGPAHSADPPRADRVTTEPMAGTPGAAIGRDDVAAGGRVAADESGAAAAAPDVDNRTAVPGAVFAEIAVSEIHANAKQPRLAFDEESLQELSHSIREFGVLQPVVVRAAESIGGGYELVMGERRLRAAVAAGLDVIPAIIRSTADDAMLRDALLENIHRVQLNPLEEAAAYQQLLEEFDTTHDQLAQRIGRSRPQVSNTIRLLNLPLAVQRRVAAGVLSAGHARALLSLDDRDRQDELAGRIVAEGLSVRATEELVSLARRDGAADAPTRRSSGPRITSPAVKQLAGDLSDVFDTRVRVDIGRRKGRITIEFASIDDLERIVGVMAPQVASARRGQPNEP